MRPASAVPALANARGAVLASQLGADWRGRRPDSLRTQRSLRVLVEWPTGNAWVIPAHQVRQARQPSNPHATGTARVDLGSAALSPDRWSLRARGRAPLHVEMSRLWTGLAEAASLGGGSWAPFPAPTGCWFDDRTIMGVDGRRQRSGGPTAKEGTPRWPLHLPIHSRVRANPAHPDERLAHPPIHRSLRAIAHGSRRPCGRSPCRLKASRSTHTTRG